MQSSYEDIVIYCADVTHKRVLVSNDGDIIQRNIRSIKNEFFLEGREIPSNVTKRQ